VPSIGVLTAVLPTCCERRAAVALVSAAILAVAAGLALAADMLEAEGMAPSNPWAADSPWPHFHRNGYAQAASPLRGPEAGDRLRIAFVSIPGRGGAPTQMHLSSRYPDGARAAWSTNLTHVVKARFRGTEFELVQALQLKERVFPVSAFWNMQLARNDQAFVPDPLNRRLLRFGDVRAGDSRSTIEVKATWTLPPEFNGKTSVINLTHDGWVVFMTDAGEVGAVRQDFSEWRRFDLAKATGDVTTHNSFPIDEGGNAYFVSSSAMSKVHWDGNNFRLIWRSAYDFRGPNCEKATGSLRSEALRTITGGKCTGSGTTPTLIGRGTMQKLVVAVDSLAPNNLVAFWRDDIPADWLGIPGLDRRIAGRIALPNATWQGRGFTVENSPPALGYRMAVAQYSGFTPNCRSLKGVQMLRWDPGRRQLVLDWVRDDVQFNNIMTISSASQLVYGIGRGDRCEQVYRGLGLTTGRTAFSLSLGAGNKFVDGGNTHALSDDRSIIFGVSQGIVRLSVE
jgi:hypothetical protein